jgi:hypothetical protein
MGIVDLAIKHIIAFDAQNISGFESSAKSTWDYVRFCIAVIGIWLFDYVSSSYDTFGQSTYSPVVTFKSMPC